MATKTQKNFRKQMAQIQKEMASKENSQFYSYIENDHIESYYKPKNKKKVAAISLGSIISFFLLGYSLYTWFRPLINNDTVDLHLTSSLTLVDNGVLSSNQKKIADYLNQIQIYENQLKKIILTEQYDFNNILRDKNTKNDFIQINTVAKSEIENIILSLSIMQAPKEMEAYHSTVKAKYDVVYEKIIFSLDYVNTTSMDITHLNFLINKQNLLSKQQHQQLLEAFDTVGIKYRKNNDSIIFYYIN